MLRIQNRTRAVVAGGAAVVLGVLIPQAGASLGGQSAPVGVSVYATVDSSLCASYSSFSDEEYTNIDVCSGRRLSAVADTDQSPPAKAGLGYPTFVYVYHCVTTDEWECDSGAYQANLTSSEVNVAPALAQGSLHADVQGCRVDLELKASDLPREGQELYRSTDTNGQLWLTLNAREGVSRHATASGSVCGVPFNGDGALAHAVDAQVRAYAPNPKG